MRRIRLLALVIGVLVVSSSCSYLQLATYKQDHGLPIPWWCHPTEEVPVNQGPAMGSVDYYAGTHKGPLSWDQCNALSAQFDQAKAYAEQWPTRGAAEADGWRMATDYVNGMGTHHIRGGITPAMLADPGFDPNMLHVWILDDMQYTPDVYAGMMPCISGGTAVHDPQDPCHTTPHTGGR